MSMGIIAAAFQLFSICGTLNTFQEEKHILLDASHADCSMYELTF